MNDNLPQNSVSHSVTPDKENKVNLVLTLNHSKEHKEWDPNLHNHYCYFNVLRKSFRFIGNSKTHTERCRCGRVKEVDYRFFIEGSNFPKRTIRWYDKEGNLERVTGDN